MTYCLHYIEGTRLKINHNVYMRILYAIIVNPQEYIYFFSFIFFTITFKMAFYSSHTHFCKRVSQQLTIMSIFLNQFLLPFDSKH